ncbi:MAG: alpha/beta hydrolase [Planctomycetota bacterium]
MALGFISSSEAISTAEPYTAKEPVRSLHVESAPSFSLPPLPEADDSHLAVEFFEAPGFERVEVLRPAKAEYRTTDPDAPAMVLIPGLGMDCRGYIKQWPLGAMVDLHLPQAMNDGVEGESGLGHFARHVEEYIVRKGLDKRPGGFVIGGSSMGGAVALNLCLRGRVTPRALVLMGSFANAAHLPFYQRALAPLAKILPIESTRRVGRILAGRFENIFGFKGSEVRWMVAETMVRTSGYFDRAIMALTRQNQIPAARALRLPTLVTHGTDDGVLPLAAGVEMAQAIPGARFVPVKGGGHGFFFTHAERVNAEIAALIRQLK